jgi:peptide chain release factor 3
MVLDSAKGVESQTIKLFKACRLRRIPIFAFINKLDRYGKAPLELLEEIERVLGIRSCPMNWPIGMGDEFHGIVNREKNRIEWYTDEGKPPQYLDLTPEGKLDTASASIIGQARQQALQDELDLLDIAGDPFDLAKVLAGELIPVYFGSAINTFGVRTFLDSYIELSPPPGNRTDAEGQPIAIASPFSGFIFKIQANMNPAHRDRIAFLRICSGLLERGTNATQIRTGKTIRLASPQQFMAQDRNIVDLAYPGDIIGLHDPGIFQIGETLSASGAFSYPRLPQFSPELFAKVINLDTGKYKQFQKGVAQLAEEGTIQVFRAANRTEDLILGVVGQLQFEVFSYRLKEEYGAQVRLEPIRYQLARWIHSEEPFNLEKLTSLSSLLVKDQYDQYAVLLESEYALRWLQDQNKKVAFTENSWSNE